MLKTLLIFLILTKMDIICQDEHCQWGFSNWVLQGGASGSQFILFFLYIFMIYVDFCTLIFFCNIVINFNSTISDVFLISCFQCLSHTISYIINTKNNLLLSTFMHLTGTFNPSDLHYTQAKLFFFLMDN